MSRRLFFSIVLLVFTNVASATSTDFIGKVYTVVSCTGEGLPNLVSLQLNITKDNLAELVLVEKNLPPVVTSIGNSYKEVNCGRLKYRFFMDPSSWSYEADFIYWGCGGNLPYSATSLWKFNSRNNGLEATFTVPRTTCELVRQ